MMAFGTLLEVAIGLTFVYVLLSVFCSGLNEWLAQTTGRRGRFLREGLINILSDRWFYLRVINHPLVASHRRDTAGKPHNPSYLPSDVVAEALLDAMVKKADHLESGKATRSRKEPLKLTDIREAAETCRKHGYRVSRAILPLLEAQGDDLQSGRKAVADWYDKSMERVTGWYKRSTRNSLLITGFLIAVVLNVDSIEIVRTLAKSDPLRQAIAAEAEETARTGTIAGYKFKRDGEETTPTPEEIKALVEAGEKLEVAGLPIGFSCLKPVLESEGGAASGIRLAVSDCMEKGFNTSSGQWVFKVIGWLITALALTLGAPFWFDLLNRFVDLRGAGGKPLPAQGQGQGGKGKANG
jgi:hypothetical protein